MGGRQIPALQQVQLVYGWQMFTLTRFHLWVKPRKPWYVVVNLTRASCVVCMSPPPLKNLSVCIRYERLYDCDRIRS